MEIIENSEPQFSLIRVQLEELTVEDMDNLSLAMAKDPAADFDLVHDKLLRGLAVPLRYTSPRGNVLFIIEENQDNNEKYIFVWYMGGKGIVGYTKYWLEAIIDYARLRGCKSIRSFSIPVIAKYMTRLGFEPQMVAMRKEI